MSPGVGTRRCAVFAEKLVLVECGRSLPYIQSMPFARKIILHVPVSNEALLDGFVEQCLADGVSLIAVVGRGCVLIEDMIDEIVVGDGSDPSRFVCTTSHPNESFDEVLNMAETWEFERCDTVEQVRL